MAYKDKEKQKEFQRIHFQNNKDKFRERCKLRRIDRAIWFYEYKIQQNFSCECGENHPSCICFHHLNPKTKINSVCQLVNAPASEEKIIEEIKKCNAMCHNCHIKHHFKINSRISKKANSKQHERRIASSKWFLDYKTKESWKCITCGESDPICLCCHHRNPNDKICAVAVMVTYAYSKEKILNEIAKCDILCQNCHNKFHSDVDLRRRSMK